MGSHMSRLPGSTMAIMALALVAAAAAPSSAWASDMDGLVFMVIVWPVGLILVGVLLVFAILGIVGLVYRSFKRRFGALALGLGAVAGVAFPVLVLHLDKRRSTEVLLLTLCPVEAMALLCVVVGVLLIRRAA